MARNGLVVVCAVTLAFLAVGACAQVNDVSAGLGRTFISDQGVPGIIANDTNIHFGDGFSYSLSYGRRIVDAGFASMTVEVPFVHDPSADLNFATNIVPKSFSAYYLAPSLRINPGAAFCLLALDQRRRRLRPLQPQLNFGIWRPQFGQEHHHRRNSARRRIGCSLDRPDQATWRSTRLLHRRA